MNVASIIAANSGWTPSVLVDAAALVDRSVIFNGAMAALIIVCLSALIPHGKDASDLMNLASIGVGAIATTALVAPLEAAGLEMWNAYSQAAASPSQRAAACGGPLGPILATIRQLESGDPAGDYTAASSVAYGAYQFVDSTWAGYAGYERASDAPPAVQDMRATADVMAILADHNGDVSTVPVGWYWPRAFDHPEDMDIVPHPENGNRLTVREYQQKWLDVLDERQADCPVYDSDGDLELVSIGPNHRLAPDAAEGFLAWQNAYGGDIPITDSYRSWDHQERRHNEEPGRFVAPEHSAHVTGEAVDVDMGAVDVERLLEAARATGWCQSAVAKNEPWHFSFNGCR